jgi:hypothetical protein
MMKTLPFAVCLSLAACQQQESKPQEGAASPAPQSAPPATVNDDPADADSYLGMTVEEAGARADKAGIRWRVVEEDGQGRPVTKDHRPDRLNFAVAAGKIIRVTKG